MEEKKSVRSKVFGRFNRLMAIARVRPVLVDPNRVRKALGEALSPARQEMKHDAYEPSIEQCDCKDMKWRHATHRRAANGEQYHGLCKHRIAAILLGDIDLSPQILEVVSQESAQ